MKLRIPIGLFSVIVVGVLGLASSAALAQSLDPTGVTTTADDVISAGTGAVSEGTGEGSGDEGPVSLPDLGVGGGGSDGDGGSGGSEGGGSALPGDAGTLLDGAGSVVGDASGSEQKGDQKDTGQRSDDSKGSSLITMTCAEAARDPRTLSAFLLTLKEGERGGGNGHGQGVAGEAAGEGEPGPAEPAQPVLPPPGPDEFPTWFGLLALIALAFGLGAVVAITAKSSLAKS